VPDDILGGPAPASAATFDQRVHDRNIETAAGWPTGHEMVVVRAQGGRVA